MREDGPVAVFGSANMLELRSAFTLSETVDGNSLFVAALDRKFGGERDEHTLGLLA